MTQTITSAGSTTVAKINAGPTGETWIIDDDVWDVGSSRQTISRSGVKVQAKTDGQTVIKGYPIDLGAADVVMQGFDMQYSVTSGDYIRMNGARSSLLRNKMHFANNAEGKWVVVNEPNCIFLDNEVWGKTKPDDLMCVNDPGVKILRNYFHDQTQSVTDTRTECIRIGASSVAAKDYNAEIAFNKFEKISADVELITVKSSNNNIHDNEFINSVASPTFRHGRFNKFVNNKLDGVGLRIYGKGHTVTGNQFKRNPNKQLLQIIIGNGSYAEEEQNTTAGYTQVRDMVFQNNTIENADGSGDIIVCWGYGSGSLKPTANKFIGNTITGSKGTLAQTRDGASWSGNAVSQNIMWATGTAKYGDMPTAGYTKKDPGTVTPTPPTPTPIPPTPTPEPTPPIVEPAPVPLTLEQRVARLELQVFGSVYQSPA